jgi:hypothetical protein
MAKGFYYVAQEYHEIQFNPEDIPRKDRIKLRTTRVPKDHSITGKFTYDHMKFKNWDSDSAFSTALNCPEGIERMVIITL